MNSCALHSDSIDEGKVGGMRISWVDIVLVPIENQDLAQVMNAFRYTVYTKRVFILIWRSFTT